MGEIISAPAQVDLEAMTPPRALLVEVGSITPAEDNVRRTPAGAASDAQLLESIRTIGILQPILARPTAEAGRYIAIDGHRRLGAARALGLERVPAIILPASEVKQLAVQAACNVVYAPLADIDQWRAVVALQEHGYSLLDAAHTLGLPERRVRQLDKLGRLHPRILEAIEAHGMPSGQYLTSVASVPLKEQAEAIKRKDVWSGSGKKAELIWWRLDQLCQRQRIPRARAIFDVEKTKVAFTEDLFAPPDSNQAITTTDVAGFLAAQRAALEDLATKSKGKILAVDWSRHDDGPAIPAGWVRHDFGAKPKGAVNYRSVVPAGYRIGEIVEVIAAPKPKASAKGKAIASAGADDEPAAPPSRGPITAKGRQMVAAAQTKALRQRIRDIALATEEGELLELLLLCLSANNVTVNGETSKYARTHFDDLAAELLDERAEQRELAPLTTRRLAGEAIARILIVTAAGEYSGSGNAAKWVGQWIEAGRAMPRLDTPDFLATLSLDALRTAATAAGLSSSGTAKALRERLAGHAEALEAPESGWRAPGPKPSIDNDDIEIEED